MTNTSSEQLASFVSDLVPSAEPGLTRVIVVVPAYNEGQRIGETLDALNSVRQDFRMRGVELRIYVVNDGSKDDTAAIAEAANVDRVVHHKLNRGLGAAVRSGMIAAREDGADVVVKFDADLQHDPEDIRELIAPVLADEADVVYGNRFDRIEYKMPFVRRVGNIVFTRLMASLTGWPLRDSQPGIFAVNGAYLSNFYLPGDYNYTQQILLDSYHKGMRFAHVPVAFRKRTTGKSFISFAYPMKVLPQILQVIIGVKPMRIFGPFGMFFLFAAFIIVAVELSLFFAGQTSRPIEHVNAVMGSMMLGINALFFGALADLIVRLHRK